MHIGSPQSRFKDLEKIIQRAPPDTYFIFAGDMIDNALRDSLGDVYSAIKNPQESLKELYSLLKDYKNRILGVVSGNHEYRTKKRVGIDPLSFYCSDLNIPYSSDILVLDLSVGTGKSGRGSKRRSNYILVIGHGYTSARTVGGKITGNARITDVVVDGDIYITGHTHQPSVVKLNRFITDRRNKNLQNHEYYLITIPAWLGYEEYAARKFLQPTASGIVQITLHGDTREKLVEIKLR